jgi:hypothetical protein
MKELLLLCVLFAGCTLVFSQDRYKTSDGTIHFNASTPLEDIDATNSRINAILTSSGEFACVLLIKDFQFRRKLMQEHFNENFMESSTYPKAQYRGNIPGFSPDAVGGQPTKLEVRGELTIHGITRQLNTSVILSSEGEALRMVSQFIIKPEDYGIEVPRILFNKIAEEVAVDLTFELLGDAPRKN